MNGQIPAPPCHKYELHEILVARARDDMNGRIAAPPPCDYQLRITPKVGARDDMNGRNAAPLLVITNCE